MRGEDEMRSRGLPYKQVEHLPTGKQLKQILKLEKTALVRAQREAIEARTFSEKIDAVLRVALVALVIAIGVSVVIGVQGHPALMKLSISAAGAWGAIATAASQLLRPKSQSGELGADP